MILTVFLCNPAMSNKPSPFFVAESDYEARLMMGLIATLDPVAPCCAVWT
jgi:hypothetical protein